MAIFTAMALLARLIPKHTPARRITRNTKDLRVLIFLRDVAQLSLTCFGGPTAHIAVFRELLVHRRGYVTDEELLELYALCQLLPGPSSTQTLTSVAFRVGGPNLAYLTLLVWVLPSVVLMALIGLLVAGLEAATGSLSFTRFVQPVAVGLVTHACLQFSQKAVRDNLTAALMIGAAAATYFFPSPYLTPFLLIVGGLATAYRFRKHERQEKSPIHVEWANFLLWLGVFVAAAVLGEVTHWLPLRLFENFYRNGSLIFGGGQVLVPLMYTEFVEFKHYLTSQEFLFGYAVTQSLPGPVFAYCTYIGVLAGRPLGLGGQLYGGLASTLGIFLPGTFLIFFIIRFWASLKKYRVVKASLEGVNAASAGLVAAAALLMFSPLEASQANISIIGGTFLVLQLTRVPSWMVIGAALLAGVVV